MKIDISKIPNPILDCGLADPFIYLHEGVYYLIGTGKARDGRYLPLYKSENLINWTFVRGVVEQGTEGAWNRKNFWAPEMLIKNNKFFLYYTASTDDTEGNTGNRVGLAVSDSPEGPFEDRGIVVKESSLDGSPFVTSDGDTFLYYTIEFGNTVVFKPGQIVVDKMISENEVEGTPELICGKHSWQEGPCVLYKDNIYYLMYSTGNWGDETYAIKWAKSRSPKGPFTEQPEPLLCSGGDVKGTGHHNFFRDEEGNYYIIYHGWDNDFTARYPRIKQLKIEDEKLSVL